MQPTDSTTPAPKPPKQGFFAKLFGKKPKDAVVPAAHDSLAPPPNLDESSAPAPIVGVDVMPASTDTVSQAAPAEVTPPAEPVAPVETPIAPIESSAPTPVPAPVEVAGPVESAPASSWPDPTAPAVTGAPAAPEAAPADPNAVPGWPTPTPESPAPNPTQPQ